MDRKKFLIIAIMFIIIIVIVIIILLVINLNKKSRANIVPYEDEGVSDEVAYYENKLALVDSQTYYFSIEKILQNYYIYIQMGNSSIAYSLLDDDYIKTNGINNDNIIEIIRSNINHNGQFGIREMYTKDSFYNSIYYVYGTIYVNLKTEDCYLVVYVDKENHTYSIKPIFKQEYEHYISERITEDINKDIKQNQYNKFSLVNLSELEIVKKYFNDYIKNAVHYPEEAYKLLEEEYSEKRFGSLEEYKKYVANNHDKLVSMDIDSIKVYEDFETEEEYSQYMLRLEMKGLNRYSIKNYDDYIEYICIDDYENCYIFRITSTMKYELILDSYTLDLPEFLEKYENTNEQGKVALNIQKFIDSINARDYRYGYSKLSDGFKNNYFSTLEQFEIYIKNLFYNENNVEYLTFKEEAGLYTYKIRVSNKEDPEANIIEKTIIVQLQEGTEFVLSFNVD